MFLFGAICVADEVETRPPVLTIPLCEKFWHRVRGNFFWDIAGTGMHFLLGRKIRYTVVVTEVEHSGAAVILKTENATRVMKYREILPGIGCCSAVHFIQADCS